MVTEPKKTISVELLKEMGYTEYKDVNVEFGERFFQKRLNDQKGIKYFINCKYYYLSNNGKPLKFWDFSMQIRTPNGAVNIDLVQWFNQDGIYLGNTIQDAEEYLEKMWLANKSPYYEYF